MYAHIVGNLGGDAELKDNNGTPFLNFSIADNVGYGDKAKTQWVRCTIWGKRAESSLKDYLKKGQQVVVRGEVSLNEWTNRDGVAQSSLQCRVEDLRLVGKKQDGASGNRSAGTPAQSKEEEVSFDDDDIPF